GGVGPTVPLPARAKPLPSSWWIVAPAGHRHGNARRWRSCALLMQRVCVRVSRYFSLASKLPINRHDRLASSDTARPLATLDTSVYLYIHFGRLWAHW